MKFPVLLVFGLGLSITSATRGEDAPCSAIEDPEERLTCFDARFPVGHSEVESKTNVESESPMPAESARLEDDLVAETPPPLRVASTEETTTFLDDGKVIFTATIRTIHAGEKQKMVFLLDNDEIWIQSSPRRLDFEEGDIVTIKNALLGGYFMRTKKGTSTRVRRVDTQP